MMEVKLPKENLRKWIHDLTNASVSLQSAFELVVDNNMDQEAMALYQSAKDRLKSLLDGMEDVFLKSEKRSINE